MPISYSAGGTDLSSRLGLASELAAPTQITMRGQPQPVVEPGEQGLAGHRPEEPDARHPVRQRDLGQVEQHVPPSTPPKTSRNTTRVTTIASAEAEVEPERVGPGVVGATGETTTRGDPDEHAAGSAGWW